MPIKRFQATILGNFYRVKTHKRTIFIETLILRCCFFFPQKKKEKEHNTCDLLAIFSKPGLARFNLWLLPENKKDNKSFVPQMSSSSFSNSSKQNYGKSGVFNVIQAFHKCVKILGFKQKQSSLSEAGSWEASQHVMLPQQAMEFFWISHFHENTWNTKAMPLTLTGNEQLFFHVQSKRLKTHSFLGFSLCFHNELLLKGMRNNFIFNNRVWCFTSSII